MTYGMTVQLPVSVAFGTDEEFDLRVQLESDLTRALASAHAALGPPLRLAEAALVKAVPAP